MRQRFLRFLGGAALLVILALLGGFIGAQLASLRLFTPPPWRPLGSPPIPATHLLGVKSGNVYVRTEDGGTYKCCWTLEGPVPTDSPSEYPCATGVEPSELPGQVAQTIATDYCGPDGGVFYRHVLLTDGTIWRWRYGITQPRASDTILISVCAGVVVGGVLGIVALRAVSRRRKGKAQSEGEETSSTSSGG